MLNKKEREQKSRTNARKKENGGSNTRPHVTIQFVKLALYKNLYRRVTLVVFSRLGLAKHDHDPNNNTKPSFEKTETNK